MDLVDRWVFTICCGTLLCGVVSILAVGKGTQRLMQLVLGLFMLCCFLLPAGMELELPELAPSAPASAMEEAAGAVTGYFLRDTARRSEEELRRLAAKELQEYGINEKDIQIYIEADGPREGSGLAFTVELVLPRQLQERQQQLLPRLEQALGIAVRLGYR
ncbi:MAG: hypothetical protein HFF14_04460 [Angelakisella sp.]|jgi:hypothetical protein|nr:hypothetical protein [Angelakisella sp.]